MWARTPEGQYFSKDFQNAVSGTTGWAEYEAPFFLKKGQRPSMFKLNVNIEGTGTIWVKDIELVEAVAGRVADPLPPATKTRVHR